jgi:hypothetical protein
MGGTVWRLFRGRWLWSSLWCRAEETAPVVVGGIDCAGAEVGHAGVAAEEAVEMKFDGCGCVDCDVDVLVVDFGEWRALD